VAPTWIEYLPSKQFKHAVVPVCTLYLPATHREHAAPLSPVAPALQVQSVRVSLSSGELEFVGHTVHCDWTLAPVDVRYVPVGQFVHGVVPVCTLYLPATHEEHAAPLSPVAPAVQVQSVRASLASDELEFVGHPVHCDWSLAPVDVRYVPAGQFVHGVFPVFTLYLPATHKEHGPPLSPVAPALQVQSVRASLASGELEFVRHPVHCDWSLAPVDVR
jgi:Na+/citrate or Na+/malate symporter